MPTLNCAASAPSGRPAAAKVTLTVESGFTGQTDLEAGGAAAGAHAVSIGREIGVKQVIIPKMAGVLSAFGILAGEIKDGDTVQISAGKDGLNIGGKAAKAA